MPQTLKIGDVADDVMARLERQAARHGQSIEAEARAILNASLGNEPRGDFWAIAAELRRSTRGRKHTPAEDLIGDGRRER